jgi:hypothetical protein
MANQYEQFSVASPYQLQQQELDRRQKMAEILQQQAFEPLQAGSYQGIQAPISPVQGLAKVLQMYLSHKNQEGLKAEQKALGEQYRADTSADIQRLIQGLQGQAGSPEMKQEPTVRDFEDNPNLASTFAEMQPDQQKAFTLPAVQAKAAGVIDPSLIGEFKTPGMQQQALSMYMSQLAPKTPLVLKEGEIAYNPTTYAKMFEGGSKSPFGNVNPASFTPASLKAFSEGGGKDFSILVPAVGADTQARLTQEAEQNKAKLAQERELSDRAFNNLSANQRASLANEGARIGISAADLFFNTGMKAGGSPGMAPVTAPQPAPQMAQPVTQAPMQARPTAPAQPVAAPVSPNQALAAALSPKAQQDLQIAQLKEQQAAAQALPQVMQQGQTLISGIDQMIGKRDASGKVIIPEHKGLKDVVGTTIPFEYKPFQGGTPGADFKALYDQVKGGAFLEAVQRMKGTGAISEIEGAKATAALTEASTAQSPDAFRNAMSKFRDAIQTGMNNAATKAGKGRIPTYNPATGRVE